MATLTNCVLFNNGGASTFVNQSPNTSVTVQNSLLEVSVTGYTDGGNNLATTASPFVSATNLQLLPCSPGIDAGTNAAPGLSGITTDVVGNSRRFNNGVVDMGAYEFQGTATVSVSNPAVTMATVNQPFSQTFTASGGVSPYNFSVASGSLPPGLSLATTGVLSGTPTQSGSFTVRVQASDANGCVGMGLPTPCW